MHTYAEVDMPKVFRADAAQEDKYLYFVQWQISNVGSPI